MNYHFFMGLVLTSGLSFDLITFDHQLRKRIPDLVNYDLEMPRYGTSVDVKVTLQNGTKKNMSFSSKELTAWGAYA